MSKITQAQEVINLVRKETDEVILFLSLGKDSLVCLDLMAPYFKRIHCVFMYFVKGLEHIERWIRWAKEKYPNIEVVQYPHVSLSRILRAGFLCTTRQTKALRLRDIIQSVKLKTGLKYAFLGFKKADGLTRRLMLMGYEKTNYIFNGNVYPLADWTQKDILCYMRTNKLPKPIVYGNDSVSNGVTFNLNCFLWMEKHFPQDLKKFFKTFPQSERILFEYKFNKKNQEEWQ